MKSTEIRQSFLDFFASRDHRMVPSAPLVPHGDPTLLFTNAGMVQFKSFFLGLEQPPSPRAASSQKCLRVSGKHNDLENVGPSPRHHTFFEMLGNFSFGDYFKEEAIRFAWELVTEGWGLPPERLFATVFREDDEAYELWRSISGLPEERVLRCGEKDNFWAMGDTGPCGPCSELFVDLAPGAPHVDWEEGSESGRYLEIWNLVFMQFERDQSGELKPLPSPSIDTGAGLERLAAVLQGVESNYDSDLFQPIIQAAAELAGTRYGAAGGGDGGEGARERDVALRVIADHLRAGAFLLADGVIPGNEGRGYVLRRLLRRAVRHGMRLGFEEPFLYRLAPAVGGVLGGAYPELGATAEATRATIEAEEEKFLSTIAAGARQVQEEIEAARRAGADRLAGSVAFRLYDTHGLPLEVIREIAEEERLGIDEAGFDKELAAQRERSRAATGEGQKRTAALIDTLSGGAEEGEEAATSFEGYDRLELEGAKVLRLARLARLPGGGNGGGNGAGNGGGVTAVERLAAGERGAAVLDRTVAYGEAGGQVGDSGRLAWPGEGAARLTDTQKTNTGLILHLLEVTGGELAVGETVTVAIDEPRRRATERNHTATHLLHAALREVLGEGVRQAGSLVAPDRLRFDFTYPRPVTVEQLATIEERVNDRVLAAVDTEIAERSYDEAIDAGAMALFGEKYGDRVRTVAIPGFSLELCGGCHVANTGAIGLTLLTGERGVASGVRRVEALTGAAALAEVRRQRALLGEVSDALGAPPERAGDEVAKLRDEVKAAERELAKLRMKMATGGAGGSGDGDGDGRSEVDGVSLLTREVPPAPSNELRNIADALRSKLGSGVIVIGSREDEKVSLVVAVSDDLTGRVHAGKLVKELASRVGGGGGGRPDFAQAGGRQPEKLEEALAAAPDLLRQQLTG